MKAGLLAVEQLLHLRRGRHIEQKGGRRGKQGRQEQSHR
jgi:hypothetical protein